MPTTRQIIAELQYDAQGWQAEGERGLRPVLEICHRYMMSGDCWQHIKINSSTGRPPILETTSGTYQYDAGSDCRKVYAIGIDALSDYVPTVFYNYYNRLAGRVVMDQRIITIGGWAYIYIEAYTQDVMRGAEAKVTFPFNPGTTDDTYYLFYYKKYDDITSDSVDPGMPERYHEILKDGVLARIGKKSYGDNNAWDHWKNVVVPKEYWFQADQAWQPKTRFVPNRQA